jgi:Arc/MetJ-type ribon-helix-helix transcriptional regulator
MPLTLTLDPHGEQLVAAHLRTGRYHSPEEVVTRALELLAEKAPPPIRRKKTPAEAVAHIRESRTGVTLGGQKIKDLIHEGHKY